jgi:hypothetical protein
MTAAIDTSHLTALINRLGAERGYLAAATKQQEIELRAVWVRQLEKEVNGEERFLGMEETDFENMMSVDDIMAELDF